MRSRRTSLAALLLAATCDAFQLSRATDRRTSIRAEVVEASGGPPRKVAVLVDVDTTSSWATEGKTFDLVMLDVFGMAARATTRRAYGDDVDAPHWRRKFVDYAFTPCKTLTDDSGAMALTIDSMDLLHADDIDTFVIASGSAALSRLAVRLREASKTVIAYGDRASPRELVNACDKFVYVDILGLDIDKELCDVGEAEANAGAELINAGGAGRARPRCYSPEELRKNNVLIELLSKAVRDNCIDTHSWAKLAAVGGQIRRIQPSFDARDLGFERIGDLYKATGLFELQTDRWGVVTIRLLEDGLLPRFSAPRPAEPRRKQLV